MSWFKNLKNKISNIANILKNKLKKESIESDFVKDEITEDSNIEGKNEQPTEQISKEEIIEEKAEEISSEIVEQILEETIESSQNEIDNMTDEISEEVFEEPIPDDKLAELNTMFEKIENDEKLAKDISDKLNEAITLDVSDEDLEQLIKANNEKDDLPAEENNLGFIGNVSVYDSEEPIDVDELELLKLEGDKKKTKKNRRGDKKNKELLDGEEETSNKKIKIEYIIISTLIVTIIVAMVIMTNLTNKTKNEFAEDKTIISQEKDTSVNTNYIYVNKETDFKGENLAIKKFLLDEVSTLLYFSNDIDIEKTTIQIIDNNEKSYKIDKSFFNKQAEKGDFKSSIIKLEPLDDLITDFRVLVRDKETNETVEFNFGLKKPLEKSPVKYTKESYKSNLQSQDNTLFVENSIFSASGTTINFRIDHKNPDNVLQIGSNLEPDVISLKEGAMSVLSDDEQLSQYTFDNENVTIGKINFAPIKNLGSKIYVNFDKVYKKINLNETINPSSLFLDRTDTQYTIERENYNIILERMGIKGTKVLLIMHAEDKNVFINTGKAVENYTNRKEVQINVDLIIPANEPNQKEIVIKGVGRSGKNGTDVLFETSDILDISSRTDFNNFKLVIKSLLIKEEPISVEIDLSKVSTSKNEDLTTASDFIVTAFENRLKYKASLLKKPQLRGFEAYILENINYKKDYVPEKYTSDLDYSAQILNISRANGKILAVVLENFTGKIGSLDVNMNRKHKVVVSDIEGQYTIIDDIINE